MEKNGTKLDTPGGQKIVKQAKKKFCSAKLKVGLGLRLGLGLGLGLEIGLLLFFILLINKMEKSIKKVPKRSQKVPKKKSGPKCKPLTSEYFHMRWLIK